MLLHYLKIAWRNILKYKTQTLVSILGLAIGFTAFSFTMSWIRYEMGYDSHNPDRDKIYRVVKIAPNELGGIARSTPEPLPQYLTATCPEVDAACFVAYRNLTVGINDRDSIRNVDMLTTDSSFFKVFYPETRLQFPQPLPKKGAYAYSKSYAEKLQSLQSHTEDMVLGIVPDQSKHSNVPFDNIRFVNRASHTDPDCPWCASWGDTYIRLKEGADIHTLSERIKNVTYKTEIINMEFSFRLVPLKKARYTLPNDETNIKFRHLQIFAIVSLLVILSALFNYLMIYINRIKIRSRELALRKVNGANFFQLMGTLLVEFTLILLASLFLGGFLTEIFHPAFTKLSQIDASQSFFTTETLLYGITIMLVTNLLIVMPISYFMKRSIRENIQPETKSFGKIKNSFTTVSLTGQLIIATLLIFCSFVFLNQLHFLNHADIGFNRHNVASVNGLAIDKNEIKKLPNIIDAIAFHSDFLPSKSSSSFTTKIAEGTPEEKMQTFETYSIDAPDYFVFFEINILEGRNFKEGETDVCIINESARKVLGKDSPIGKKLGAWIIIGVIPDLLTQDPLLPVKPSIYKTFLDKNITNTGGGSIAYRFADGKRTEIEQIIYKKSEETQQIRPPQFWYMDDEFDKYTKSDRYLLVLLGIMTSVAVLIALFGIYSMITLACSQRRKEIAIRKINGAKVKEILALFFKQYLSITLLACIAAFPFGIFVMQRWLEQYTRRVTMQWRLFVGVTFLVLAIVFASIVFRVLKAAKANPVESLKSE